MAQRKQAKATCVVGVNNEEPWHRYFFILLLLGSSISFFFNFSATKNKTKQKMYLSFRWRIAHQAGRGRTPAECPEIQHHTCHPSLVATVVAVVLKADTGERRGRFLPQKEMQLLLTEPTPPPSSLKIIRPTKSPDCRGSTDGARLARRSVPAAICCVSCPMELSTLAAVPLTQTVSLPFFY